MKKVFIFSITINLLFIIYSGFVIQKRGGFDYLSKRFNPQKEMVVIEKHNDYYRASKSIFEIMPNDTSDIIFLGNSITDYCDWHELFGVANIKNRGIAGDDIYGVTERLTEVLDSYPKKIFLMIGINDIASGNAIEKIIVDYDKLITLIIRNSPKTELYIQSILPTDNREAKKVADIIEVNKRLKILAAKYNLVYVDLFNLLKNEQNKLDTKYTFDGLHLNGAAYLIWKKAIERFVMI